MTPTLLDGPPPTEARLPLAALAALAPLRDRPDVRVRVAGDFAWASWGASGPAVVRALLGADGVTLYRTVNGVRTPVARRLPATDAPPPGAGESLAAALVPEPLRLLPTASGGVSRVELRLVRGGPPRPATALTCSLTELAAWADGATTRELASVRGLLADDRAILFGDTLPSLAGATRLAGDNVLTPVGFRLDPPLPDDIVCAAAGVTSGNVMLFHEADFDAVPRDRAEPLTRAAVLLALAGAP